MPEPQGVAQGRISSFRYWECLCATEARLAMLGVISGRFRRGRSMGRVGHLVDRMSGARGGPDVRAATADHGGAGPL
jgi:hypothetical protein